MSQKVPFYQRLCIPVSPGKSEQGEAVRRCVQGCSLLMSLQLPVLCVYIPAGTSPISQLKHLNQNKSLLHLADEALEVKGKGLTEAQNDLGTGYGGVFERFGLEGTFKVSFVPTPPIMGRDTFH